MAGDWIKMTIHLDTDPAVIEMAGSLSIDRLGVVGRLWKVWSWADQHSVSGHAVRVTQSFLDELTGSQGFAKAMRDVGWLEGRDGALTFPRFDRHNGQTAKTRALGKDRKRESRHDSVTQQCGQERDQRREEKSTESPHPTAARAGHWPRRIEDVIAVGKNLGLAQSESEAFWHHYESVGWVNGAGIAITNWQSQLHKWQRGDRPQKGTHAGNSSGGDWRALPPDAAPKVEIPRL